MGEKDGTFVPISPKAPALPAFSIFMLLIEKMISLQRD